LELFGGKLEVQSIPNQGTRVCIYMPMPDYAAISLPAAPLVLLPEIPLSKRDLPQVPDKKIRILLADDHAVVRQGMAAMLNDEVDFEVVGGAADGQEAVEMTRKLMPEVVLMDMSMPVLNGIEAARIISRELPDIRIIGLSMFDDSERSEAMRDAGAVYYLTKSGPAEELINAIRRMVVRSS
jgi:CheY-like chemotaxis protein